MQDGTGHGAETRLGRPGLLGRRKSSCCRLYRGLFRRHTCERQDLPQQMVALHLWRYSKSGARNRGALSKDDDKGM
jgi:hypothetical protein